jgi:hypothetical protein
VAKKETDSKRARSTRKRVAKPPTRKAGGKATTRGGSKPLRAAAGAGGGSGGSPPPASMFMPPPPAKALASGEPNPAKPVGFASFLSEVSEAMLAAQHQLDLQTEAYLSGGSGPRPLPTLFRLPKLHGAMKFALTREQDKKMQLVFYSGSSSASTMNEQSLEFDLVAVPPPPESRMVPVEYVPLLPRIELLLERGRRITTLERILMNNVVCATLDLPLGANAQEHPEVGVWELVPPIDPKDPDKKIDRCVLAARRVDAAPNSRLCLVQIAAEPPLKVKALDVGALDAWIGDFLSRLAERQKQLFERTT